MRRIVLTTSDIQKYLPGSDVPRYKPTGLLERAIEEGYEVFITTTRTKLVETDDWWRKLVPDDHIFLTDPSVEDMQEQLSSGWKKCVTALGLSWPTEGDLKSDHKDRLGSDWADKPGRWTDVQHWLPSQDIDTVHALRK